MSISGVQGRASPGTILSWYMASYSQLITKFIQYSRKVAVARMAPVTELQLSSPPSNSTGLETE